MSVEALTWALSQPIKKSTAKFVLVVMANYSDAEMICWPSTAHLCEKTSQDRKTVMENIKRLRELGYISDTGYRKGATKQVIVYKLNNTEEAIEEARKRNSTENGTVPFFPTNSPVFPDKQSRFSLLTVPKTGHGYKRDTPSDTSLKQKKEIVFILPSWIPEETWNAYLEMRNKIKKKPTDFACQLVVKELEKIRVAGGDFEAALNNSIKNSWTDVYAPKIYSNGLSQDDARKAANAAANAEAKRMLFGSMDEEERTIDA